MLAISSVRDFKVRILISELDNKKYVLCASILVEFQDIKTNVFCL